MTIAVYKITCLKNNKVYIGSSSNAERRMTTHRRHLRNNNHANPHLQNAWNKYTPTDFSFDLIEICSLSDLINKEQYWIDNTENLFNIRIHSVLSPKNIPWSEETREKITKTNSTLETKNRRRQAALHSLAENPNRNGLFTSETAKKNNLKKSKKYLALSPNGKIYFFSNINNFCRVHNLNQPNLTQVANGSRRFHRQFRCIPATPERLAFLASHNIATDIEPNSILELDDFEWDHIENQYLSE